MFKVSKKRMYGIEKIKIGNSDVAVSDRERTLIDLIYFPYPVGGLKKAFEILKEQVNGKKINQQRLIKYTSVFPNVSTRKRIGVMLDSCGLNNREISPLLKSVFKTSLGTLYESKSRKGKINKKWGIIENAAP